jgi:hypothetical protein
MGELAAETLLKRIRGGEYPKIIAVEPELIVRESTGAPPISALEDLDEVPFTQTNKQAAEDRESLD